VTILLTVCPQVVVDYVAMTEDGRIFDNSLEKGKPYDIRIVEDNAEADVIAGLNEGIKGLRVGGIRRLYIPGELSFPKGLASGPGRPRVPPASPVLFDVKLVLLPGSFEE
jgi:peptidylprolyl isomerase